MRNRENVKLTLESLLLFILLIILNRFSFIHQSNVAAMEYIQQLPGDFWRYAFLPFVLVGSPEISVGTLLLISFWLYGKKEYQKAYLVLAALLVATALEISMKQWLYNPPVPSEYLGRFPFVPIIGSTDLEMPHPFPSGHSFRSAMLFGVLFLWTGVVKCRRVYLAGVTSYCVLQIVGMNYYGFHWLTDCLGGYSLAWVVYFVLKGCGNHELPKGSGTHH